MAKKAHTSRVLKDGVELRIPIDALRFFKDNGWQEKKQDEPVIEPSIRK